MPKGVELFIVTLEVKYTIFIGDRLPEFMVKVAVMVEHINPDEVAFTKDNQDSYYYAHFFNIGGYWSITTRWLENEHRESPEEMAKIIEEIVYRKL